MQISTSWQDERWHYADTACRRIAALLPMLPAEYGKHMFTYGTVRRDSSVPVCLFIRIFPFAGAEGERSDACLFFEHAAKITVIRKTDCFGYLSDGVIRFRQQPFSLAEPPPLYIFAYALPANAGKQMGKIVLVCIAFPRQIFKSYFLSIVQVDIVYNGIKNSSRIQQVFGVFGFVDKTKQIHE